MTYGPQGALDAAIDALEKAVKLAPDVPDFCAHLGYVSGLATHIAGAEQLLNQLNKLATPRYMPYYNFTG
jgi:cytochrome c-type biogenesis protein CcmH/NrfG